MTDLPFEALLANPRVRVVETPPPVVEAPPSCAAAVPAPLPTAEHVAAVDGAFLRQRHEQETIANLIGLRLSILLMHDLAKDAIPTEEEMPQDKPRPEGDDDSPSAE